MIINRQSGLVKLVILMIVAILVLSYFGFDIQGVIESPLAQKNLGYVKDGVVFVWKEYLSQPMSYFWNNIFINLIWGAFVENMDRVKSGSPTELQERVEGMLEFNN